jgi:UDP-glucose 4-epimerase
MEAFMSSTKVLVTGVGGYWGTRLAKKISEHPEYHVMGLDTVAPKEPIPGLDFIQADIRNPLLADLFKSEQVEIVYHLAFKESVRPSEAAFDYNVLGTMKVFGACVEAGVRKIIFKSSTAVYGAAPQNQAFLTEQSPLHGSRSYGSVRDLVEIEAFCNGFLRQSPQVKLTILRFANILGPTVDTPLARYLKAQLSPSLLGFDPMMQMIHEDDVVDALVLAGTDDFSGVFNVAAEDLMPLTKVMGLAGQLRMPVFHLFAYWGYGAMGGKGLRLSRHVPIELDYIRYRWVGDLQRMREILNFVPKHTAEETLRQFAEQRQAKSYIPEVITRAYDKDRLREIIERRHSQDQSGDAEEGLEVENHD